MGQISVNLTDTESDQTEAQQDPQLKKLTIGLPSAGKARVENVRYAPRLTWSFTNIPQPIKDRSVARANEMGMGHKQFFYHCLRKGGVDIPEDIMIDARRCRVGYFDNEEQDT